MNFWRVVRIAAIAIVVGFLVYELGAPLWLRYDLDRGADKVADLAADEFKRTRSSSKAEDVAGEEAAKRHMILRDFRILGDPKDAVRITVTKRVDGFVLDEWGPTNDWFIATRTADSTRIKPFNVNEKNDN